MRRNPLSDPIKAFNTILAILEKALFRAKRAFKEELDNIYSNKIEDRFQDGRIRYLVKYLSRWYTAMETIKWMKEGLQYAEQEGDLDLIVSSLLNKLAWMEGGSTGDGGWHSLKTSPHFRYLQRQFGPMQKLAGVDLSGYRFSVARYSDEFIRIEDEFADACLHEAESSFMHLGWLLEDLLAGIRAEDTFDIDDSGHLINQKHITMAELVSDRELANIRDHINSVITGRTYYGFSNTYNLDTLVSTKLTWSNGSASWHISDCFYNNNLKNVLVRDLPASSGFMDTNIIIVPYPKEIVKLILSSLYPLPMYGMSLEGKQRKSSAGGSRLITDRTAKRLVVGLVMRKLVKRYPDSSLRPQSPSVSWLVKDTMDALLEAKANQDDKAFVENLKGFEGSSGELGQLRNWFSSGVLPISDDNELEPWQQDPDWWRD